MSGSASYVGLPIQEASRRLGVPAPTLRSWERRYALPATGRTAGGHRRYSEAVLVELGLLRDEIAVGRSPADAARRVRLLLDERSRARPVVAQLLAAANGGRPRELRSVLEETAAGLGLSRALDDVVLPALRQLGSWWETTGCDMGPERLAVDVVRGWLAEMVVLGPAVGPVSVLLAVGPQDRHTVGIEALAAVLSSEGTASRVLGSCADSATLVDAVTAGAPSVVAVVVVSHLASHRRAAVEVLAASAASTGCATFFAGNAFVLPRSRAGVPGTYLGESITDAAAVIWSLTGDAAAPPPLASAG